MSQYQGPQDQPPGQPFQPSSQPPQPYGGPPQQGHPGATAYAMPPQPPKKKRRVWLWVLIGVLALLLIVVVACSAVVGKAAVDAAQEAQPSVVATDAADPSTEPTEEPSSAPSADGGTGAIGDTLRYPDGVEVKITKTDNAKVGEYAAGGHPGDPMTVFTIKVTNKSDHNLQGDIVSVDATYGADGENADSVYDSGNISDRISGTITKGRAKTGDYAFAIPSKSRGDVTIEINVDYEHESAIFSGSVK